ncbi:uncharacterized protein LOC127862526 isoform X2 [Dreissena polymorpha]|uniref:uncharacterized protein LOC127862526 isoform X2 n=1 Tax=Dreissena polymorpha TaxID=45954 RepID=UPI002263BE5E|nr:uncharacterized protein LOC127862526 isoform X2 [Dreissena polymorpha]
MRLMADVDKCSHSSIDCRRWRHCYCSRSTRSISCWFWIRWCCGWVLSRFPSGPSSRSRKLVRHWTERRRSRIRDRRECRPIGHRVGYWICNVESRIQHLGGIIVYKR